MSIVKKETIYNVNSILKKLQEGGYIRSVFINIWKPESIILYDNSGNKIKYINKSEFALLRKHIKSEKVNDKEIKITLSDQQRDIKKQKLVTNYKNNSKKFDKKH